MQREQTQEIKNERQILQYLKKVPNMSHMKSAWADKQYYYLLFDYAINGDLTGFLKSKGPLPPEVALHFSAQILAMLNSLRRERVVHRDIKPANILLDENWVLKLADFGSAKKKISSNISSISRMSGMSDISYVSGLSNVSYISNISANDAPIRAESLSQEEDEDLVGSESYVSPEMVDKKRYSFASDLWAFGIIVYQLYSHRVPFRGKNQDETFELIKKGEYTMDEEIPEQAADLIRKLLVMAPEDRLGAKFMDDLNNHPLFKGLDLEQVRN